MDNTKSEELPKVTTVTLPREHMLLLAMFAGLGSAVMSGSSGTATMGRLVINLHVASLGKEEAEAAVRSIEKFIKSQTSIIRQDMSEADKKFVEQLKDTLFKDKQ